MHMDYPAPVPLGQRDKTVFVIIGKLHRPAVREFLADDAEPPVIGVLHGGDPAGILHLCDPSVFPIGIAVFCTGCRCHLFEFSFPVCQLHAPSGVVGHFFKLSFFIIRVGQAAPIVCLRFFKFSIFEIGKRYAPSVPVFFPEHLSVPVKRYDLRARMFEHVSCFRFF